MGSPRERGLRVGQDAPEKGRTRLPGGQVVGRLDPRHGDERLARFVSIVESWDIEKMMEEPPTFDMRRRHPQADTRLIDHLVRLEA